MDINTFATGGIQSNGGFYGGGLAGQRFDRKFAFQVKVNLNVAFYSICKISQLLIQAISFVLRPTVIIRAICLVSFTT